MNSTFFADTVSETLLIPLYMRAKESRRGEKAIIRDPVAERLVEQIPYDYSKFDGAVLSEVGCNVRAWYLDNVVRDYVRSHVNPIIVNLGCGFDARTQRTTIESSARYYSIDLPEVIAARDRLLPPAENETYVPGSMFDEKWMAELKSANPEAEFLFIAEGVVMYFREDEIKSLFQKLLKHFPGCEIWFDLCGTLSVKNQNKHDTVKKVSARFNWGLDNGRDIEKWDSRIQLIRQSSQGLFFRNRYPFFMRVMTISHRLMFRFCSIVGYRLS